MGVKGIVTKSISLFIVIILVIRGVTVYAGNVDEALTTQNKIEDDLKSKMLEMSDNDLIQVYIWMKDIDVQKIEDKLIEQGYDPEIYSHEETFNEFILPEVTREVIREIGIIDAAQDIEAINNSELIGNIFIRKINNLQKVQSTDENMVSLVDVSASKQMEEYRIIRSNLIKEECCQYNESFLEKNEVREKGRKVIYNSQYTRTIVLEATKEEILNYTEEQEVDCISLYEELLVKPAMNIVSEQVNIDNFYGTKGFIYNSGFGYKGTGVKIGILEAEGGIYDSNAIQLEPVNGTRLHCLDNIREDGSYVEANISDHATMVTSIIIGKSVTINGQVYEGVVPNATVYEMPTINNIDVYRGIEQLIEQGVSVINFSAGFLTGDVYHDIDKEIDKIIYESNITFVSAAGNIFRNVTTPGKAFNVITVGNVQTKLDTESRYPEPYPIYASSYEEPAYLANKPDISAPGTNITIALTNEERYTDSGTSFAAPIVTGIIAQMMQAKTTLQLNPVGTKAELLLGADDDKISTIDNAQVNYHLREKSGAGFVDAAGAVDASLTTNYMALKFNSVNNPSVIGRYYFLAGQSIRLVMTFDKPNYISVETMSDLDDLDVCIIEEDTAEVVDEATSGINNVEIIEYTFENSGYYTIEVHPYKIIDSSRAVNCAVAWKVN